MRGAALITVVLIVFLPLVGYAEESVDQPHVATAVGTAACRSAEEGFDNVQIETSDIAQFDRLFQQLLRAELLQRLDHPQTDHLRVYCFRGVAVVIRQDLRTPRPTGWVQLNFTVRDVAAVQRELEAVARTLPEEERERIARFRLKPGVMRGHRKVDRLELYGPERFLIGFDQPQSTP